MGHHREQLVALLLQRPSNPGLQAELQITDSTRVELRFRQGGWIGPSMPNRQQLMLMRQVQQSSPA